MADLLFVCVHGIGESKKGFSAPWVDEIKKRIPANCPHEVAFDELLWEEDLKKVQTDYPPISDNFAAFLDLFGFNKVKKLLSNESYRMFESYVMDVVSYTWAGFARQYLVKAASQTLLQINETAGIPPENTILFGHSLGSVLITHLAYRRYAVDEQFRALVLAGSPLGFRYPPAEPISDFLKILSEMSSVPDAGPDRINLLRSFVNAAYYGKFYMIGNRRDPVCSDPMVQVPVLGDIDIIPYKQAFASEERLRLAASGVKFFDFETGSTDVARVIENHDALGYLKSQEFANVLGEVLV